MFRVLFTFPSRYWYTIGLPGVFSLGGWSRRIQTGFHVPRPTQDTTIFNAPYLYRAITVYGHAFQHVLVRYAKNVVVLQPQYCRNNIGLGWSDFARHYYRNHSCFLFLRLLRCFSSAGWPLSMLCLQHSGLPHSDIHGSTLMCSSPWLFAAYHVLHRLWVA